MKKLSPAEVKTIIQNAPQGSNPNTIVEALIQKGYILEGLNDQPQPEKEGFLRTIGKDVAETLLVKPADRFAEAVGRTGILGEDIKKGYETMSDEGQSRQFNVPGLGGIDVEAQKSGAEGNRQIAGEALKIGSFLFPYGKVAGAVGGKILGSASKLTPTALKTAKVAGNVASGVSGGYMADVGYNLADDSKTLGESFIPGLGTVLGGAIPLTGTLAKAGRKAIKGSKTATDVTKRVIQGETSDIPLAEQAFKNLDLKGVKTRQELSQKLSDAMENQMNLVDQELAKDTRALSLDDYAIRVKNNAGQEVKTDVISNALFHLEDFFKQSGDNVSASNINLIKQKAISEGLTHQEVNNIARMYSKEFGSKAFNRMGDPLTSVNAQMFENTRSGLKQASRGGLGFGEEAKQADKLYSAMSNTKRLIDKGVEGVNKLESRLKDRNIFQKLSYGAVKVINALTGGVLKSAVEALGVSNVGNKIDNWVNLERSLKKDLEFIQKANTIKSDSALIKFIESSYKGLKFPGDAFLDTKTGKKVIDYAKNPKVGMSIEDVSKKSLKVKGVIPKELDSLAQEAKKYKSAEDFANKVPSDVLDKLREQGVRGGEQRMKFWEDIMGKKTGDTYQMAHRPTEGVSAFNLTEKVNGEQMIPKDMYTQWYGSRGTPADLESIAVLKKIKGNPEANVTIYRASPKESFNNGDWVTFSKKYAQEHATGNNSKVFSKVVKAKDVRWAMDDVNEFGYFPKSQLTDFYNKAVGKNKK